MEHLLAAIKIVVIATLVCYWSSRGENAQGDNLVPITNVSTMMECVKKALAESIDIERVVFCSKNSSCYTYNKDPAPEIFNRHPDCQCFVTPVLSQLPENYNETKFIVEDGV